jgi:hypothetical protein
MSHLQWSGFHAASRVTFPVRALKSVLYLVHLPVYWKTGRVGDQSREVKKKGRRKLKKGLINREIEVSKHNGKTGRMKDRKRV